MLASMAGKVFHAFLIHAFHINIEIGENSYQFNYLLIVPAKSG